MTTIYERLTNQDYSIEPILIAQLFNLLKIVSGIDLSGKTTAFNHNVIISRGFVTFELNFSCGVASVTSKNGLLTADFKFLKQLSQQFPFNVLHCQINLDHNMNFEQARFEYYIHVSKYNWNRNDPSHSYCAIKINQVLDKNLNRRNTFSYNNLFSKTFRTEDDLFDFGLHSEFAVPNEQFEKELIKFLHLFKTDPHTFYNIFTEYPTFSNVIDKIDQAKDFFNLFHSQYINDFDVLKARMLLVDMQEI